MSWRSSSSSSARRRRPRSASSSVAGRCTARSASGSGGQVEPPPERGGQDLGTERDQRVEMAVDQRADQLVAQPFGGRIHRQHLALLPRATRRCRPPRPGPGTPAAPSGGRGRTGPGPPPAGSGRPRWSGRETPGPARRIPARRSRPAAPRGRSGALAGGDHTLGHHRADAGDVVADPGPGQRGDGRGVDVAMREMPEQILRGGDAEPLQRLRPALADALEELDRRIEAAEASGTAYFASLPTSSSAKRRGIERPRDRPPALRCRGSGSAARARGGAPRPRLPGRCRRAW